MNEHVLSMISDNRPDTATLYCVLSSQYLRYNMGELEVYCNYAKVWKESAIKDLKLAQVLELN